MTDLAQRYRAVGQRIEAACRRAGRSVDEITVVAVSKTFPVEAVEALLGLGQVDFGENKVQELASKAGRVPGTVEGGSVRWHAIGHLQRNKAREVVRHADVFHALDSDRLAEELDRRSGDAGRVLPCLVQVNVSFEDTKSGLPPADVHAFLDRMTAYPSLSVRGLMTLASPVSNPEDVRPQFAVLRELARSYRGGPAAPVLEWLSMGMSHDFEIAIEEGATHVRIGSAIFGDR